MIGTWYSLHRAAGDGEVWQSGKVVYRVETPEEGVEEKGEVTAQVTGSKDGVCQGTTSVVFTRTDKPYLFKFRVRTYSGEL